MGTRGAIGAAALCVLVACEGRIGGALPSTPIASASPTPTASPSATPTPSPTAPAAPVPLPPGIRRLTRREVVASIQALFPGIMVDVDELPADTRQSDFAQNRAQIVDPVFAGAVESVAREVAARAVSQQWSTVVPCAQGDAVDAACAAATLERLASGALRGTPSRTELDALQAVFAVGVAEGDARLGVQLVIEALLQSPSFLYTRELSAGRLDRREIAEALAFLLTGRGPDAALLAADLADPSVRAREARRLYATPVAHAHLARALLEWLRLDRLGETAKDANTYPEFFALRGSMEAEARLLLTAALDQPDTLHHLLTTEDLGLDPVMSRFYGYGALARPGILSRAAFASVYASPTESSPVKRGNAILMKLACVELPLPIELMIDIVPPLPDPALTTRERYAQHSRDMACAGCHAQIDPLGFAFEGFDGMGAARTTENQRPVDTVVDVIVPASARGRHADHGALIAALAASPQVDACFARQVFRFAAGTRAPSLEDGLVELWKARPADGERSLVDVLLVYVTSDAFVTRVEP